MSPNDDGFSSVLKRLLDLVLCAAIAVFFALPVMAIIIAIKKDSPGPVLFRQFRCGQNGVLFLIYKFRTLHVEHRDSHANRLVCRSDNRVTRVGKFLRRYHLDELPQIINVLKFEMSIIGPRPHAVGAKAEGVPYSALSSRYQDRYNVLPGITGLAQVNGWHGNTDTKEKLLTRLEYDLKYIDNWSPALDLWIVLKTPLAMLR